MQEFYKIAAKKKLREYVATKDNLNRLKDKIEELENSLIANGVATYGLDFKGGSSNADDKIINIKAEIDICRENYRDNKRLVEEVQYGLQEMSEEEKDILLQIYGSNGRYSKDKIIRNLSRIYHYEKSTLYSKANYSLKEFSYRIFGNA